MAQWVKVFATKPDDLCSIAETPMLKERTNSHKLFSDLPKLNKCSNN